jgi:hypothetical protein
MVPTPLLTMMLLLAPPVVFRSMMAWRSEPAPLSALLLTMKSAAQTGQGDRQVPASRAAAKRPAIFERSILRFIVSPVRPARFFSAARLPASACRLRSKKSQRSRRHGA